LLSETLVSFLSWHEMKMMFALLLSVGLGFGPAFAILYVAGCIPDHSLVSSAASEQGAIL
jgi:hypothetical protein